MLLRLSDTDRAVASDASGHHHDGSYVGDTTRAARGALAYDDDGALRLDGAGGHARLDALPELRGGASLSLELWVRPDAVVAARPLLSFGGGDAGSGVSVWTTASGGLVADLVTAEGASHARFAQPTVRSLRGRGVASW